MTKVIALTAFLAAIAAVLAYIGIARPALLWDAAKIQNLVHRIGESGARAVFLALAGVNVAAAVFVFVKGRTAG